MKKFFLCASNHEPKLQQAANDLRVGDDRHDILQRSIRALEEDPNDDSLGVGGYPNLLGEMELDAAFMDGDTRAVGAVAGVGNYLPVEIARRLMRQGLHCALQGTGAELFARDCGLTPLPTLTDAQRDKWRREIKPLLDGRGGQTHMDIVRRIAFPAGRNLDTAIMIASDGSGISGAASTAGWPYKHPGRVGDTPIIGAGMYVDSRFGGACCTWTGEMSIRTALARFVVTQMEAGKPPRDAVLAAVDDIEHLRGGLLQALVIHAIDRDGVAFVAAVNAGQPVYYQYWHEDLSMPQRRQAESVSVVFPTPNP